MEPSRRRRGDSEADCYEEQATVPPRNGLQLWNPGNKETHTAFGVQVAGYSGVIMTTMGSSPLLVLVVLWMVVVVAGRLAIWAWRGKREGNHPVCRTCGFDLTGRPETSSRCSECRTDLTSPQAIRIGHQRRRAGWLASALAVLAIAVGIFGTGVVFVVREMDWSPYKPTSWLTGDLASATSPARAAALRELYRRMDAEKKLDSGMLAAIDRLLKIQANANATWYRRWGT